MLMVTFIDTMDQYGQTTQNKTTLNKITINSSCELVWSDLGNVTTFNMITYSGNSCVPNGDIINIGFAFEWSKNFHMINTHYQTYVYFKGHIFDDIIFVGFKAAYFRDGRVKNKNFVLVYNKTISKCIGSSSFNYVMLNLDDLDLRSPSFMVDVFNHRSDRLICICYQQVYKSDANVYVYRIKDQTCEAISQITLKNVSVDTIDYIGRGHVSVAFMGKHLVCVNKNKNLMTITWINSADWSYICFVETNLIFSSKRGKCVEETITLPIRDSKIVRIKLIGIHDYLSAMIVFNRPNFSAQGECLANIYYF